MFSHAGKIKVLRKLFQLLEKGDLIIDEKKIEQKKKKIGYYKKLKEINDFL